MKQIGLVLTLTCFVFSCTPSQKDPNQTKFGNPPTAEAIKRFEEQEAKDRIYQDKIKEGVKTGKAPQFTPEEQARWDAENNASIAFTVKSGDEKKIASIFELWKVGTGKNLDANIRDKNGDTLLILAVKSGSIGAVRELLKNGADMSLKGSNGKTAKDIANDLSRPDIVSLLK